MAEHSVFVIWTNPLFHETVRLILQHPEVRLVGASSDRTTTKDKIAALNPDVVIIEETGAHDSVETMSILMAGPIVIRLSLDDNELNVYRRQQQTAAKQEDLVRMIVEGLSD